MATLLAGATVFWFTIASADSVGVVYHIDDAKNGRFALHLAEGHLSINPEMQIAIVTYAAGVDFLLKAAKDKKGRLYETDLQALIKKGVHFRVCSATLGFRGIAKDQVLDGITLVPSGTYESTFVESLPPSPGLWRCTLHPPRVLRAPRSKEHRAARALDWHGTSSCHLRARPVATS